MQDLIRKLLADLGEDPDREGLRDTPKRVEKALKFLTSGYSADIDQVLNNALFTVDYSEMVIVKDIDFYSLCEHHLLPFFGKCHVAYIPSNKVIGLSKIPRLVDVFARRLQVQERLTNQIADTIRDKIAPLGVAVVMEATHLCMSMRGVEKQNSFAVTSAMQGAFRDNARTRMEFLELIKLRSAVARPARSRPATPASGTTDREIHACHFVGARHIDVDRLVGSAGAVSGRRRADHRTADRYSPSVEPGVVARRPPRRVPVGSAPASPTSLSPTSPSSTRPAAARALTRYADGQGGGFFWSADSRASTSRGGGDLWQVAVDGGEPSAVWTTPQAESGITPSPDGTRVAFVRRRRRRAAAPRAAAAVEAAVAAAAPAAI